MVIFYLKKTGKFEKKVMLYYSPPFEIISISNN